MRHTLGSMGSQPRRGFGRILHARVLPHDHTPRDARWASPQLAGSRDKWHGFHQF